MGCRSGTAGGPTARGAAQITSALGSRALLLLLLLASGVPLVRCQRWREALRQFSPESDQAPQRAALESLLAALGAPNSTLLTTPLQVDVIGSPGVVPWGTPNTSYCAWWGVNCCGATLTASLQLCSYGTNSIAGLHIVAANLSGPLPDVFDDLPDLQVMDISFNRGAARVQRAGGARAPCLHRRMRPHAPAWHAAAPCSHNPRTTLPARTRRPPGPAAAEPRVAAQPLAPGRDRHAGDVLRHPAAAAAHSRRKG